jgi:GT2 family glycosyltransferase
MAARRGRSGAAVPADGGTIDTELPGAAETRAFARGEHRDPAALTQFKRALAQSLPPAAAADEYRRQLDLPDSCRFTWRPIAGLREVAAAEAATFHEIAAGGEPLVAPSPQIIGGGNRHPLAGMTRSLYVACLLDARVCGRSAFVDYGGRALIDAEQHERQGVGDRLDCDPAVVAATEEAVCLLGAADAAGEIEIEDAFCLLGPHSWRFGAWLQEYLGKYVAATMARALPPVPVLIDADLPPRHRQALAAMLRHGAGIIELPPLRAARVRRLWCAASPAYSPLATERGGGFAWDLLAAAPARLAPIRAEMVRRAVPPAPAAEAGGLLFLAGDPKARHDLANLSTLAANAAARGFRVVDPGTLDFMGQVALVRGGSLIAGAAPEAMDLACFARPGTKLCLLHGADTAPLPIWNGFLADSGLDITVLAGADADPAQPGTYRIDAAALCGVLEGWRADGASAAIAAAPGLQEPPPAPWRAAPRRDDRPLVSVLCVAYRQERFVREAVRSILAQSYAPLDIVILDDASPDATGDMIADELAHHPGRNDVRFMRNPRNLGFFGNVRKGLSVARGEFVVVFCGDDIMMPLMVEKMVAAWREADVSLVTANAAYIDSDGNDLHRFYTDPTGSYDDSFEALARNGYNAVCFGAAIGFERRLFLEFGYPPEFLAVEDIMLPFYAYLAKGARYVPEPLIHYRVHADNDSLGLRRERAGPIEKLLVEAEMYSVHLVHSVEMAAELERRRARDPVRFGRIAERIRPLLAEQRNAMTGRLVETRMKLATLGVTRLIAPAVATGVGAEIVAPNS